MNVGIFFFLTFQYAAACRRPHCQSLRVCFCCFGLSVLSSYCRNVLNALCSLSEFKTSVPVHRTSALGEEEKQAELALEGFIVDV